VATVVGKVQVQTKDINNLPASISVDVAATSGLLADLQAYTLGYLPLLDAVVGSQILDANLVIPVTLPTGLKAGPLSGNNQMVGALVRYFAGATATYETVEYFGADPAIFQPTPHSTDVDLTSGSAFSNYYAYLTTASNNTQGVLPGGGHISALIYAIKNSRKNRRGLERRHRK
jgi:hypothetical protein